MKIDVRAGSTFEDLTTCGMKPAKHCNGKVQISPEDLAEQANGVIAFLAGKNLNYYHAALIFDTALNAIKESMLTQTL